MARSRNPEKKMKLSGHLREFRNRLFKSAFAIVGGGIIGWITFDQVFSALQQPIIDLARDEHVNATINFNSVVSAFDLHLQIAFFVGLFISSPVWLYQVLAFITPALKKRERRYTIGFLFLSSPVFLAGAWFGWWLFPEFIRSLLSFTPPGAANVINAAEYVLFAVRVLLVFGLAFVLPIILVFLNALGVISGKTILKGWRPAIFIIAVIGAIATPVSDPMSMFLLMLPLTVLYFVAAAVALANDKRRAARQKNELVTDLLIDEVTE
jgi:sec-independent protein translocase protein TatC